MISLMKEREDNPAATLIGPEIYTSVYGSPSPDHNVLLLREYEMNSLCHRGNASYNTL